MTQQKNQRKANGHAGPHRRTNGHAPASTERGGIPAHRDQAASDDANGASVAIAATSAAAGTDHGAHADAAPPPPPWINGEAGQAGKTSEIKIPLTGPTDLAALQDGGAYVDAVAKRIDLVAASVKLVMSGDDKIAKAELDRLRDMKFGKVPSAVIEETPRVEPGDIPRPAR